MLLISDTLQLHAEASGQCINFEKSSAYFSSNTSESQRQWIEQALGVREVDRFELEVLIKVVAQSIPTYTMGVFLLPAKFCNELNALCARFWWGQTDDERKINCKSWNFLTKQKREGGTGFWDIRSFNFAMLAKQG